MGAPHRFFVCLALTLTVFLLLAFAAPHSKSQVQTPPPGGKPEQGGQTIRVKVALVQTDVEVVDKQGRFVPDLKLNQFELRIDGKVQPISFLELVSAESPQDQAAWAKAESETVPVPPQPAATSSNPGRTVLIFLDDWHLSNDSILRSRAAISNLIKTSMGPKDSVAIFMATGQLASLRQLTSDKAAMLASLEKLRYQSSGAQDLESPLMSEAQAVLIAQGDGHVMTLFLPAVSGRSEDEIRQGRMANPDIWREIEEAMLVVRKRANALASASAAIAQRSLDALSSLLTAYETLPGRKMVLLLSDGFVLQPNISDTARTIMRLTDAAARAGFVIYTLDARSLAAGQPDAKTRRGADRSGSLAHSGSNEVAAPQDVLDALSANTGGRFLKNTDALNTALSTAVEEISRYYMLAWPFDPEQVKPGKHSIVQVAIKGRPNLGVRLRQGALDLSRLVSVKPSVPAVPPEQTPVHVYAGARTVVDMSVEELLRAYPEELRDVTIEENSERLNLLLKKLGEGVETFFRDFPNTVSKEAVRLESSGPNHSVGRTVTQNFNYAFFPAKDGRLWKEARLDSKGREIANDEIKGFPFFTSGYAGLCMFFHPHHQFGSEFRYLGKQGSSPNADLIAFAQKPESGDVLGAYQTATMPAPVPLLCQGLAWVNPGDYQILRMRTDLLARRTDIDLTRQTSEIWFSEVRFQSVPQSFWLPREVVVTSESSGWVFRNIHRYSDYRVFTVETQEKVEPPKKK
jgi:VWFA-related protein